MRKKGEGGNVEGAKLTGLVRMTGKFAQAERKFQFISHFRFHFYRKKGKKNALPFSQLITSDLKRKGENVSSKMEMHPSDLDTFCEHDS